MNALIYLNLQHGPYLEQDDLERLDTLRRYTQDTGYTVSQVWPVYEPEDARDRSREWYGAKDDLADGRFDAIVYWFDPNSAPDIFTQDDLN